MRASPILQVLASLAGTLSALTFARAATDPFQPDIPSALVDDLDRAKGKRLVGNTEEALTDLKKIVEQRPDYYRAIYNYGLALADTAGADKMKLAAGIGLLEEARSVRENKTLKDYSIYNSLGWYYNQANRSAEAENAYLTALKHVKDNTTDTNRRLFTNVGVFYMSRGDLDRAQTYLKTAAEKYNSDTARNFLEINEAAQKKSEIPDNLTYHARLSDRDKENSKGVKFVDSIRQKEGTEPALLETLLQDRSNFYHSSKHDPEDEASPGLESTSNNRTEFLKRKLEFIDITADECLDREAVVKVTLTKSSIQVANAEK